MIIFTGVTLPDRGQVRKRNSIADSGRRVRRRGNEAQTSVSNQAAANLLDSAAMDVVSVSSESPEVNTGLSNSPVQAEIEL